MLFNTVIPCSMAAALRYIYTNGNVLLPFFSLNSLYSNKEKNRRRKREAQTKVFSRPYRHIWLEQIAIDRSSIAIVAFVFQRFLRRRRRRHRMEVFFSLFLLSTAEWQLCPCFTISIRQSHTF